MYDDLYRINHREDNLTLLKKINVSISVWFVGSNLQPTLFRLGIFVNEDI